jgi:hypothetical protein
MKKKPFISDDLELHCPLCGFHCLHHEKVEGFFRREDDDLTLVATMSSSEVDNFVTPNHTTENPSDRRGGVQITFWCEGCGEHSKLAISQHKGSTYVFWR